MKKHPIFPGLLTAVLLGALFLLCSPQAVSAAGEWNVYLGQLHAHSGDMDKIGPAEAVFSAARDSGMDFFALTDYSHSFENSQNGSITAEGAAISPTWSDGKAAAEAASGDGFLAIFGYEMGWQRDLRLGHIVTFGTPGWQCRGQDGFNRLPAYYEVLTNVDASIGMFCHPGEFYGDFENFSHHRWDYDDHMALLEVSGEDGALFLEGYQRALDQGWHVAPAANEASHRGNWGASPVRTGILADSLTETSLLDAIRARRVFATLDKELEVQFSLGGHMMGSRLSKMEDYTARFQLSHPRGTIEIVSKGGQVVASCGSGETSLTVPGGFPYYYLRVVEDGQILAVTAPIWVEVPSDFGCSALTSSTSVPVQNEELTLSFTLFNHEHSDLALHEIQLTADGNLIWIDSVTLSPGQEKTITLPYTHTGVGITNFQLCAAGTLDGEAVSFQKELTLSYRPPVLNAHILVDGSHSPVSAGDLENLTALAEKADMDVAIFRDALPGDAQVIILPPPNRDFTEGYPQLLENFVENGGQLILCGQAGNNEQINHLLAALGSTMSLNNDTARDPVNNGGSEDRLFPDEFNPTAWESLTGNEYYSHQTGCTVNPGKGTWLVKGENTMVGSSPVLLAKETLGNGTLFLAGSFFLNDDHMPLPANQWDTPRGNQVLVESILGTQRSRLPITDIKTVRSGELGSVFRIQGYVTAGTSDPYNRFPGLIYVQDQTGGIEITHFNLPDIQIGVKLDITGQLCLDGKNPALKLVSCQVIPGNLYRFDPDRLFHAASMNYERHGGELMKVEGIAQDIVFTEDGLGVCRLILMDPMDVPAEILVEDYILSGAYGVNHLADEVKMGDNIRAYGILHLEENGNPVLRVRNCDEVVNIPPVPEIPEKPPKKEESDNPKTGDVSFTFDHFWSTMWKKE